MLKVLAKRSEIVKLLEVVFNDVSSLIVKYTCCNSSNISLTSAK